MITHLPRIRRNLRPQQPRHFQTRGCCSAQGLLPLFWPQLRAGVSVLLLAGSLALLAALGPAMWRMWIVVGSANANYFYAATLLFGAWQVLRSDPRPSSSPVPSYIRQRELVALQRRWLPSPL